MVNRVGREKIRISTVGKVTDRGYTLIELSVVVLLIGMMLLIAVPRVRDTLLNDDLRAAARQIIGASREIRNEAVREQVDTILHLDLSQPGFWTYAADTTAEKRAEIRKGAIRFPAGIRIAGVRHAEEVAKTDGEASVRFFRRGYVEPSVIHLVKDDRAFTLVFNPFLHAVNVYEKYVDFTFNENDRAAGF
jgi:prepilin-type N-terminal cleavage/methylation domain-containing protein